jgi:hypothetical protein
MVEQPVGQLDDETFGPGSDNPCSYVYNNPINMTDPSGLKGQGHHPGRPGNPVPKAPAGPPPDCSSYQRSCDCTSYWNPCQKTYYCLAAMVVCENAGNGPWSNCVRTCLQRADENRKQLIEDGNVPIIGVLIGCLEHLPLEGIDHAWCFAACAWDSSSY